MFVNERATHNTTRLHQKYVFPICSRYSPSSENGATYSIPCVGYILPVTERGRVCMGGRC